MTVNGQSDHQLPAASVKQYQYKQFSSNMYNFTYITSISSICCLWVIRFKMYEIKTEEVA